VKLLKLESNMKGTEVKDARKMKDHVIHY